MLATMDTRDRAMTALILGFFASSWFGWAQERPPAAWRTTLIVASVASLLAAVTGAVLAWRGWSSGSALGEPGAMRRYGILVGIEFAVAGLGAAGIGVWGDPDYIAPWICLVVGVHFVPMAPLLRDPALIVLGALLIVVAVVAVLVARRGDLALSFLTGVGAGALLLAYATWNVAAVIGSNTSTP
jgi:hypothetical protein